MGKKTSERDRKMGEKTGEIMALCERKKFFGWGDFVCLNGILKDE